MAGAGPGPAVYKLKTLTGSSDHCRTKPRAPAYSMGLSLKGRNIILSISILSL